MGLVSAALRAGTYPAISATVLSNTTMVVKVAGSVGAVPNKRVAISLATTKEANTPATIPAIARRNVFQMTSSCTCPGVAPRAMRIPISCVRCVTE